MKLHNSVDLTVQNLITNLLILVICTFLPLNGSFKYWEFFCE
jgi:hypothetical protein